MNEAFRLSRLRAPRGTAPAMILLALVFVAFGLTVAGLAADDVTAPHYFDGTAHRVVGWLFGN